MKLSIEQKKIIDNCFPFAGKVIPVTESQRQCMFTAVEAVLEEQAGTLTDAAEPIEFRDWWISQGKFIDPDTEDVPWFDKREALCEAAYEAGQSSVKFAEAYLAQRTPEPAPAHDYTSTACQHELHERCRKNCKFCLATCKCECHGKSAPTPHPEDCLCVACEDKALPAPDGLELPGGGE